MPNRRHDAPANHDLNLAPIMNMVVILIPLLLLSVVFLKVGTINVSTPDLVTGLTPSERLEDEPLRLTVGIGGSGFTLSTSGTTLAARAGCPPAGPTVCTADGVSASDAFDDARRHFERGDTSAGEAALGRGVNSYDWPGLYNELARIKAEHEDETIINVTADPDVPYAAIVRVMDVARFKLEKDQYTSASDFWSARYASARQPLFSDPVLNIAR